jgi:hypothetical protein
MTLSTRLQPDIKKTQGKGGGGQRWGPRGPVSKDTGSSGPFAHLQNLNQLRSILETKDTAPYQLDRGERNDAPFEDGLLQPKIKSSGECRDLLLEKYGCKKHGVLNKEAMCYLPPKGDYAGKHIRIGNVQVQLITVYMVNYSHRSFVYSTEQI